MLDGSPYQGYLYAYPHKTAYRPLRPRPALADVWAGEPRDALFAYLHVPFCEMRCGFCNLFTRSNPPAEQVAGYLTQLAHEAAAGQITVGQLVAVYGYVGVLIVPVGFLIESVQEFSRGLVVDQLETAV